MVVTKKKLTRLDTLDYLREEYERRLATPILKTRWAIIEKIPAYEETGYYGQYFPAKNTTITYCYSQEEADKYIEEHESDRGVLYVQIQNLREFKETRWVNY